MDKYILVKASYKGYLMQAHSGNFVYRSKI